MLGTLGALGFIPQLNLDVFLGGVLLNLEIVRVAREKIFPRLFYFYLESLGALLEAALYRHTVSSHIISYRAIP